MVAEIAENRPFEYVSIRHIGEVKNGVEDTTSQAVRAWALAYENFEFVGAKGGSEVMVELDTLPDYEPFLLDVYPKALKLQKEPCEDRAT